jgi:hypothetical protein
VECLVKAHEVSCVMCLRWKECLLNIRRVVRLSVFYRCQDHKTVFNLKADPEPRALLDRRSAPDDKAPSRLESYTACGLVPRPLSPGTGHRSSKFSPLPPRLFKGVMP